MAIVITPESEYGKELAKWEQHPGRLGLTPGNPYQYRPFPKMVYRAMKKENGKVVCLEAPPPIHWFTNQAEYQTACARAEALAAECCKEVRDESELNIALGQGWVVGGPKVAVEAFEKREQEIGNAAAEANAAAARMTDKAQRERKKREDATHEHVPD